MFSFCFYVSLVRVKTQNWSVTFLGSWNLCPGRQVRIYLVVAGRVEVIHWLLITLWCLSYLLQTHTKNSFSSLLVVWSGNKIVKKEKYVRVLTLNGTVCIYAVSKSINKGLCFFHSKFYHVHFLSPLFFLEVLK